MIGGAVAAPALAGSTGSTMVVLIVLLIALGMAMVAVAVWLVRSTRTDAPALAPLEVMGDRGFSKADSDERTTKLTSVRPPGAPPPAPMLPYDDAEEPPPPEESLPVEQPPEEVEPAQDAAVGEER
jgi:hypothetical protein